MQADYCSFIVTPSCAKFAKFLICALFLIKGSFLGYAPVNRLPSGVQGEAEPREPAERSAVWARFLSSPYTPLGSLFTG